MKNNCNCCGLCCKLFLINLSEKEYISQEYETVFKKFGKIENFNKVKIYGANLLAQKKDGSCIYLLNQKCKIHKIRPNVCRKFFCTSKAKTFKGMIKIIENSKLELAVEKVA